MRWIMHRGQTLSLLAATCLALALGGCGRPVITADDVVVAPGQPAQFMMSLDRQYGKASVVGADVEFLVDGRPVGAAKTDANGVAVVTAQLAGAPSDYTVRARVGEESVRGRGRIFQWDGSRTAVAIDVDDTISTTDYGALFLTDLDTTSPHVAYSPAAVQAMARDFEIVYLSARPRWLHEKTKVWLQTHGFPPGPVLHASRFEACFHQERYKSEMLAEFQHQFPNLLIGVGDKLVDDRAYGDNRMLAVIIEQQDSGYRDHCVVFPDWRGIERFFEDHRAELADSSRLQRLIHDNNMKLRSHFARATGKPLAPTAGAIAARAEAASIPPAVAAPAPSQRLDSVAKANSADRAGDGSVQRGDWVYGYQ